MNESNNIMNINSLNENYFDSNPNNLLFLKNLVEDSYSEICLDNTFSIFYLLMKFYI